MKRRLFLHLGTSKTGTTSIQSFLRGNPDALAAQGVIYPLVGGAGSSHPALAPSVLRRGGGPEVNHVALAMEIAQGSGASAMAAAQTPLWSAAFADIEAVNAHTAIISYENFYIRPDLSRFDMIADRLKHFDVYGIIYLRPQQDWIISLYGQLVRGRTRMNRSFAEFITMQKRNLLYSEMLDDIVSHIPLDDLIVVDFEKASASGLLADFLEKTGLSRDIPLQAPESDPTNRSVPGWVVQFLLKCNQSQISDETFVKVRQMLASIKSRDVPHLRPGLDVATPEEREGLRVAAVADADRLRERYGIIVTQRNRERVAYRPFDDEDVATIKRALAAKLPRPEMETLDDI